MSLFQEILNGITGRLHGNEIQKLNIAKEIGNTIGITVKPDEIKIKNKKLFLNVSPTVKTSILLKKEKILSVLSKYDVTTIG